jgi:SAM-dependent methyltransferase
MATSTDEHRERPAPVDPDALRAEVREKYRVVAESPDAGFHFHTGRVLARRCRYPRAMVDPLPDAVVESFAGVANPFELAAIRPGERVVDIGCGAGFDTVLAGQAAGPGGRVIGVDMTPQMLRKAEANVRSLGLDNVEIREGLAEDLPVEDGWADVVIANGVFNLCAEKRAVFEEVVRVLRPGGRLQFADIANGRPVPEEAVRNIDLWTG